MEYDIDDLIDGLAEKVKEGAQVTFEDLINYECSLKREIFISGIVDGTGTMVDTLIRYWNRQDEGIPVEERQPIKLYIDSPGGSLTDAFTVSDAVRMSKTPVYGICSGIAYSGGFLILISCHKRFGYPHSSYLFHEGQTKSSGTASQFENYTAFYKRQLVQLKHIVLDTTKITEEEYEKIKKDDVWYDAEDALEKGIIDEISKELI
jgi:ATP-dependent Clp protease protease subunit